MDPRKKYKDSWTWTTVCGLLGWRGVGGIRGLNGNGKNIIKIELRRN